MGRDTRSHPNGDIGRMAHEELAYTLVRSSRYAEAASEFAAELQLMRAEDADRPDIEDDRAFCELLRGTPVQTVEFGPEVTVRARRRDQWVVPVNVSGSKAEWLFDTGANSSVVTESEAMRIGLSVFTGSTSVNGSTGKKTEVRVGVAQDLQLGRAHLRNVAFAVIPDGALPSHAPRGILGLPVIRAFGSVSISVRGAVHIEPNPAASPGEPNIFFEALTPVVEVRHGGRLLQMALDTGALRSDLYPSFREALREDETGHLRKQQVGRRGVGETVVRTLDTAPKLDLALPGRIARLHDVPLLAEPLRELRFEDGVIGTDAWPAVSRWTSRTCN